MSYKGAINKELVGQVISRPHQAAGLGAVASQHTSSTSLAQRLSASNTAARASLAGKASKTSARAAYQRVEIEDADSMPDSAPERPEGLYSRTQRPDGPSRSEARLAAETCPTSLQRTHASVRAARAGAEADASADEGDEALASANSQGLLKPRRKFTRTKALALGLGSSSVASSDAHDAVANDADTLADARDSRSLPASSAMPLPLLASMPLSMTPATSDGLLAPPESTCGNSDAVEAAQDAGGAEGEALGGVLRMQLGAGEGWELAHVDGDGGRQPVLRRTQRTVSIRGKDEEDDEETDAQYGREQSLQQHRRQSSSVEQYGREEAQEPPSARTATAASAEAEGKEAAREPCSRHKKDEVTGSEQAGGGTCGEPTSAAVGRLFGVGAMFKRSADGFFYVKKMVAGGPADKAGVQVGSRVVSMDGERLYNKTAEQLFKIVLGSEGTTLKLVLQAPGASVRAAEHVLLLRRAFIDEAFLNATAIEALPKGDSAASAAAPSAPTRSLDQSDFGVGAGALSGVQAVAAADGATDVAGIGVTFKKDLDGWYMVKRVLPGGGAYLCGLKVGDRVVSIDGHKMHRKSPQELARSVLGPHATAVTLSVRSQDGIVRDVQVKRKTMHANPAEQDFDLDFEEGAVGADGKWDADSEEEDGEFEGGCSGIDSAEWDGEGEVMVLEDVMVSETEPPVVMVGIGATLVRDSRGLFVVAQIAPPPPDARQGRSHNLFVGDIIVQIDGIQVISLLCCLFSLDVDEHSLLHVSLSHSHLP